MKRHLRITTLCVIATLSLAFSAKMAESATIAEDDFSTGILIGGTGDWVTNWATNINGSTLTADPSSFALEVDLTATAANGRGSVYRRFADDNSAVRTITFDYTIDEFPTTGGIAKRDRFSLSANPAVGATAGSSSSWIVYGGEDLSDFGAGLSNTWLFHNGTGDGTQNDGGAGENDMVDSGITMVVGDTYRFTIVEDPAAGSYVAAVDNLDDVAVGFTSGSLGYRGATFANPYLTFGTRTSDSGDTAGFTLDNVAVSVVPEPASLMLLGLGGLLAFGLGRRQR